MEALERKVLEQVSGSGVDKPTAPGISLAAESKDGSFKYAKAFGKTSLKPDAKDFTLDSVNWIASCTKLMTAVAVMQCVERGLVTLDDDITGVLSEWKDAQVLVGFDDAGEPILKKAQQKLTLRRLLTHTAGTAYTMFEPKIAKYMEYQMAKGVSAGSLSTRGPFFYPITLSYEPGESWAYGTGLDWAGLAVERLNDGISLEKYMQKNIWQPLGMTSTTFDPISRPDLMKRLSDISVRDPEGGLVPADVVGPPYDTLGTPKQPPNETGGSGVFAPVTDHLKFLTAVLRNEGVLLKKETMLELFEPQLDAGFFQGVRDKLDSLTRSVFAIPDDTPANWALGGLLVTGDVPGGRRKGTISWSGMSNPHWWIDPQAELCGLYTEQVLPPGDPKTLALYAEFQKAVYQARA